MGKGVSYVKFCHEVDVPPVNGPNYYDSATMLSYIVLYLYKPLCYDCIAFAYVVAVVTKIHQLTSPENLTQIESF